MWNIFIAAIYMLLGVVDSRAVSEMVRTPGMVAYDTSYAGSNGYNSGYLRNFYDHDQGYNTLAQDPLAFQQQLTYQILAQNTAYQRLRRQHQANFFNHFRRPNRFNYVNNMNDRFTPNFAAAFASVGPTGGDQTSYISPENPDNPNISNRFSPVSPDGYKGVSVSAHSSSSNIGGKITSYREAETTINDNGRISTYKVSS